MSTNDPLRPVTAQELFDDLTDPNNPLRQREWNAFLERRNMLLDDMLAKLGLGAATQAAGIEGVTAPEAISAVDDAAIVDAYQRMQQAPIAQAMKPEGMRERDYQQVLGSAWLNEIQNPETIPFGQLQQMIEDARTRRRDSPDADDEHFMKGVALTSGGPVFLGPVNALARSVETIPFGIGDWFSDRESVQALNQWIGMAREAHSGAMDPSELMGAQITESISGMVGYIAPGIAAWRTTGWAMGAARIGGVTQAATTIRGAEIIQESARSWGLMARNPILHQSIQGGLTSLLLEAGGDAPIQERALNVTIGTGLGVTFAMGGPVAAASAGALAGGIVGSVESVDHPFIGAMTGAAVGLGLNRAYRAFSRTSGLSLAKHSTWFEPIEGGWVQGFPDDKLLPPGNVRRAPAMPTPEPTPTAPSFRMIESQSGVSSAIERFTFRGTRTMFYGGDETPDMLVRRWSDVEATGIIPEGSTNRLTLDNTGKMLPGVRNVHEVEARFDNLLVLTPESAPLLRHLTQGAQDLDDIRRILKGVGFDGLAVQGLDDAIAIAGIDAVQEATGIPSALLSDQVIAFGSPTQVKYSRPILDGDLLEQAFVDFGSKAGRQVAGIQSATFSREAAKMLQPFDVGESFNVQRSPTWLSESRGVRFIRDPNAPPNPMVPAEIDSAVLQHNEAVGPRVVLLTADRIARATIPVASLDEGAATLARLGFSHMNPNDGAEAIRLAHQLTNADIYVNNSMLDVIGRLGDPMPADLVAIAYLDNPGRIAIISDIGSPTLLRESLGMIPSRHANFDRDMVIVERPEGVFHAIVGPKGANRKQVAKEFKAFGIFSGMEASTAAGASIRVNKIWTQGGLSSATPRHLASISPIYSDIEATVPLDYILPGRVSVQNPLTGDVYAQFKKFALGEFNREASAAGIELASELADPRVLSLVDRYIERFGAVNNLVTPYELGRFADSLEWNLAGDIRKLAGVDGEMFEQATRDHAEAITAATLRGETLVPDVAEMAVAKGFIWEPAWRGKSGQLVDQSSNLVVPFVDKVSAIGFLRTFNRSPAELPSDPYGTAFTGFQTQTIKPANGVEFVSEAAEIDAMKGTMREMAREADTMVNDMSVAEEVLRIVDELPVTQDAGGGNVPPTPPPPPAGAAFPDGFEDRLRAALHRGGDKRIASGRSTSVPGPLNDHAASVETMLNEIDATYTGQENQVGQLKNALNGFFMHAFAPMRIASMKVDEHFRKMGITRPRFWESNEAILQGKIMADNEAAPWLKEGWYILAKFDRGDRRLGQLGDVLTAPSAMTGDVTAQTRLMDQYEFTPEQRVAVGEFRDFMSRANAGISGFNDIDSIFDALERLRYFIDVHGDAGIDAWAYSLPDNQKWAAEYAREGGLQNFYKDVGRVMEMWFRGMTFEKHVRVPYERARAIWTDERVPEVLRNYEDEFLYVVRHGRPMGGDRVLKTAKAMIDWASDTSNALVGTPRVHVTEGEVLNVIGASMKMQYNTLLGGAIIGQPSKLIREGYQPMLMGAQIGMGRMAGAYAKYAGSSDVRRAWTERALRYGWVQPYKPVVANSEVFTGELRDMSGGSGMDVDVAAAREGLARRWDAVYDALPNSIKNGVQGNPYLDQLYTYGGVTNRGRIFAGNAAYEVAVDAIDKWMRLEISYADMLQQSNAGNQAWSVKQDFIERIAAGDFEGAAARMGSVGVGTQFYTGIAENSAMIRGAGAAGKFGAQLGNFSNQFFWQIGRDTSSRGWTENAKYWARLGTLMALPAYIGVKLGWEELNRMGWYKAAGFGGGPIVDVAANLLYTNTGVRRLLTGEELSPEERFSMARFGTIMREYASTYIPHRGTWRTASGYINALGDSNPTEAFFRQTITGESGSAATERFLDDFSRQLQMVPGAAPSPVAFSREGITPAELEAFFNGADIFTPGAGAIQ